MGKSKFINIMIALIFFVAAGLFVIAATGNNLEKQISKASPKKDYAPAKPKMKPSRGLPSPKPGASRELDDNWPDSAFNDPQSRPRPTYTLSPENVVPAIREFANWKIGLRYLSANVKDVLSLFFTIIGTFFTWRSYRIQKNIQRSHLMPPEN